MVQELYAANKLLIGNDGGNISTKTSFLDQNGNIQDFAITTIIAPAPNRAVELKGHRSVDVQVEDFLHVNIKTDSLDAEEKDKSWYVGEYAKNKENSLQPKVNAEGEAEEKFTEQNKAIFVVPLLTSIAVAAIKSDKIKVEVPISTGVPVETYKKRGSKLIEIFYGTHYVTFIDGPYSGKTIEIVVTEGEIQVESVTTSIALEFTIKDGECVESEISKKIGQRYALSDLGAGSTDVAVFTENGVEKSQTHNTLIGTNKYIDAIIHEISELEVFSEVKQQLIDSGKTGHDLLPFPSREKFVNAHIKPQVNAALSSDNHYEPTFKVNWAWVKNQDVTEIVLKHIKQYVEDQKKSLLGTYAQLDVEHFLLVGGGVLFGYLGGINELNTKYGMEFPNLKESQFFTSRAYLIASYLTQWEKSLSKA